MGTYKPKIPFDKYLSLPGFCWLLLVFVGFSSLLMKLYVMEEW